MARGLDPDMLTTPDSLLCCSRKRCSIDLCRVCQSSSCSGAPPVSDVLGLFRVARHVFLCDASRRRSYVRSCRVNRVTLVCLRRCPSSCSAEVLRGTCRSARGRSMTCARRLRHRSIVAELLFAIEEARAKEATTIASGPTKSGEDSKRLIGHRATRDHCHREEAILRDQVCYRRYRSRETIVRVVLQVLRSRDAT